MVPMLEVLDFSNTTRSTARRSVTTVAPQALSLYNGHFVNRQAQHFADRLIHQAPDDPAKQIEFAYRLALCRPPHPNETKLMQQFLTEESAKDKDHRRALIQMCRVILNLNEFVYPD